MKQVVFHNFLDQATTHTRYRFECQRTIEIYFTLVLPCMCLLSKTLCSLFLKDIRTVQMHVSGGCGASEDLEPVLHTGTMPFDHYITMC